SKRIKKGFFVCDGLWKTKTLFLLAYCGEKQVPIALGEPLERWENHWSVGVRWLGGCKYFVRSTPLFYLIGWYWFTACCNCSSSVCLYWMVV
ncbi:hypothetical protein, partial [Flavobacterium covae]|uniref:hypothetical protein n=1 Tax=Flavobacterium covae TaxID=2906076 RepID=UPI003392024E